VEIRGDGSKGTSRALEKEISGNLFRKGRLTFTKQYPSGRGEERREERNSAVGGGVTCKRTVCLGGGYVGACVGKSCRGTVGAKRRKV